MSDTLPPLTAELWARVRDRFSELDDGSVRGRAAELARLEREDPDVAAHLRAMFAVSTRESPLDRPIADIADELISPDVMRLWGEQFGPYRLVKLIGRGGMGVVYLGHRDDLEAPAAIKILLNAWIDPGRRDQFTEEMRILAALSHQSIAGLLHAGQLDDGTPWFAMQYIEGLPITQWAWDNALDAEHILKLFDGLCAAVQYAHAHPVIHRDLKPSNILVNRDGEVKLLDFGIAKRPETAVRSDDARTTTREVTFEYAAPEQLRGQVAGARADVYALGVILYELLCRRRPYDASGISAADVEAAMRAAYPPTIGRTFPSETRRDLDALIARATAIELDARYGSVEEMRRDIQSFLEGRPLAARPAGLPLRARKLVRRRWKEVSVATVVMAAALVGLALHNREMAASRDLAIAEAARTTRLRLYLEDLFKGGSSSIRPIDSIRVATLVDNGIREARGLTTDPELQVELFTTLGSMTQRMGELDRADSLFRLAIDRGSEVYGEHHPEVLRARVRRALLTGQRGKTDSAAAELFVVDTLAHEFATHGHPVVAEADAALGSFLRSRDRSLLAIRYLEQAVDEERQRDSTSREYAVALRELGNAVDASGNLARADSLWLRALPLVERRFGPRHPDVAFLLADLGTTAAQRGQFAEAERYQREAVAITSDWYGPSHYLTGAPRGALAQTLLRLGRVDEAIPMLNSAIDALASSPDVGTTAVATNVFRTSLAYGLSLKGDHAGAAKQYGSAIAGLRRAEGDRGKGVIAASANMALELVSVGQVDSGIVILERQERAARDAYGDSSVVAAQVNVQLGRALLARHDANGAIRTITGGLAILDRTVGAGAAQSRAARTQLMNAYLAIGDSAGASRVKQVLESAAAAAERKKH